MPATNAYDQASRFLARLDAEGVLAWLTGLPPNAFALEGWLNTRMLPWPGDPERTCGTVAHLRDQARGGMPWAVVVEFQAEPDPLMFGRLLVYLGQLWESVKPSPERGDRFELGRIVVNLTGKGDSRRDMHWPESGLGMQLRGADVNLGERKAAEVLDGIAAGKVTKAVLGWIPLMQGGDEDAIIQRWKELADADQKRRAEHAVLALVYAEAAKRSAAWKKALEGWNVIQSKQVAEWQAQAVAESVVRVLDARVGSPTEDLIQSIRTTLDMATLNRWLHLAATAASLDDFRRDAGL
jgi:hypothetical protein